MRLGIIGTGRIAKRAVKELTQVPEIELVSVFNPNLDHGRMFAKSAAEFYGAEEGSITAHPSLASFTASIDAAYIATPHGTHYSYAEKMLLAGKHVLCEKPLVFRADDAKELYSLAGERSLVLMEAIKTAYCPGFKKIIEVAESGIIGQVVDVQASFTRLLEKGGREFDPEVLGGSFTEYGTYTMLPIFRLLGTGFDKVSFRSIAAKSGVDGYTRAEFEYFTPEKGEEGDGEEGRLRYSNSRQVAALATARTGLTAKSEGQLLISGTEGYILVPSPWWLTRYFEVRFEDPSRIERYTCEFEGDGLRYEFAEFARRADEGDFSYIEGAENSLFPEEKEALARAKVYELLFRRNQ